MTGCSRLVALLTDYLEGRLSAETHADLEKHLAACSDCVAFVRTFRSTLSLLHSLTEQDLPPELLIRLRAFLDTQARS